MKKNQIKKLALSIFILLLMIISGVTVYFSFFYKCPYKIGIPIKEWMSMPCPYIVKGEVINWISEGPVDGVRISLGQKETYSSVQGFLIETREDLLNKMINKVTVSKKGYIPKEIDFQISETDKNINLGKISLLPEGRILYQKGYSIFSANFDGSGIKKLTDGELVAIAPIYDKFVFKTQDSALRLMDIQGNYQMKFAYQSSQLSRPTFTTFALDGNILAWIASYEVEGPQGKRRDEEVFYFNFELEKQKSVSQIFRNIYNFRISPDGKYIAVAGISYDGSHVIHLEDIVRRKPLLQVKNPETYFFDEENFYYSVPGSGWYIYHLKDGKTDFFDIEPIWWENKFSGKINPYTKENIAILRPGWVIKLADINGLNAKRLIEIEPPTGYVKNLRWSSNQNCLLFEISKPYSLWILDIDSSKYKQINLDE